MKVIGLLSEKDVVNARDNCLLEGVQVVVAMPEYARRAIDDHRYTVMRVMRAMSVMRVTRVMRVMRAMRVRVL